MERPMRRRTAVVAGVVLSIVLVFFFAAPVEYYGNISPVAGSTMPFYRSLGCVVFGYGVAYSPKGSGFQLGCQVPYMI